MEGIVDRAHDGIDDIAAFLRDELDG
jgi:hypothetical protein